MTKDLAFLAGLDNFLYMEDFIVEVAKKLK
jgi:hypothetical protein